MFHFLEDSNSYWQQILDFLKGEGQYAGTNPIVRYALIAVGGLIVLLSIFAIIVDIWLAIRYHKYNKTENSAHLTGQDAARKFLDKEGLQNIKVSCSGSFLFGNSYSHYFKKVRLRRLTWKKSSVSSLAMAAQKSSLAVLDKENDPDMKQRIRLVPLITFGPYAFIPLIIVGVVLDILVLTTIELPICTLILTGVGFLFYVFSFILSIVTYKTEIKAQKKALELLRKDGLATEEELTMMQDLFKLYNIEYINDMIMALLEIIYRILRIVLVLTSKGSTTSSSSSND